MTAELFPQVAKVITVSELTRSIRGALETKFGAVWVHGEISNYKQHPNGHQYFTLKDQRAQISCVIWRDNAVAFKQPLADGAQVQVYGNVTVFEARGQYQLSAQIVQPRGIGLLQAKFEALKRKLEAEGLFDAARKRALPKFPKRVGIVTSPSGAAIRDMLNVLKRRAPNIDILISPVRVQGTGAAAEIAVATRELSRMDVDLVVLARGGGSIEDLWEFNEEIVARAIADSPVPVVSAIGHEIDFTIADFVADLRAPTPSAAAELISANIVDVARRVAELRNCLGRSLATFLSHSRTRLRFLSERTLSRELLSRMRDAQQRIDLSRDALNRHLTGNIDNLRRRIRDAALVVQAKSPEREVAARRAKLVDLQRRFEMLPPRVFADVRKRFSQTEAMLRVLGPQATLERGYSITTTADGKVIRSAKAVRPKMKIRTRVSDGEFGSTAD